MDEDSENPEVHTEPEDAAEESPRMKPRAVILDVLVVLIVAILMYIGLAKTAGVLLLVLLSVGLPATLLWFVWHVFLRKLWRVRRIRSAQERRELMDAALRGRQSKGDSSETTPR